MRSPVDPYAKLIAALTETHPSAELTGTEKWNLWDLDSKTFIFLYKEILVETYIMASYYICSGKKL